MKHRKNIRMLLAVVLSLTLVFAGYPMDAAYAATTQKETYIVIPEVGYFESIRAQYFEHLSEVVPTIASAISGRLMLLDLTPADMDEIFEENPIAENTDAIEMAENDYVEGSWGRSDHELSAGNGENFLPSATYLINYVKIGTRVNDDAILGMTMNPMFHGYLYKDGKSCG